MAGVALTATGISHAYGDQAVLRDVSLQVGRGEWVALVGPSGSGKSTLLSIVGLLLVPDAGTVAIGHHRDVLKLRRRRRVAVARDLGWVFQTSNAQPRRLVIDNVAGPLVLRGHPHHRARRRAYGVLDQLGIVHLAHKQARDLSGGELQRVSVARAVVTDPSVIVADEPTGQLDAATTTDVLDTLRRASDLGAGVLVATHDQEVAAHADRILTLRDGQVEP